MSSFSSRNCLGIATLCSLVSSSTYNFRPFLPTSKCPAWRRHVGGLHESKPVRVSTDPLNRRRLSWYLAFLRPSVWSKHHALLSELDMMVLPSFFSFIFGPWANFHEQFFMFVSLSSSPSGLKKTLQCKTHSFFPEGISTFKTLPG